MNKRLIAIVLSLFLTCPTQAALSFVSANSQYCIGTASNGYISPSGNITIMAWMNISGQARIVGTYIATGSANEMIIGSINGTTYAFRVYNSLGAFASSSVTGGTVGVGWVHLCGTINGTTGTLAFYINGQLIGTTTLTGSWVSTNNPIIVGAFSSGSGGFSPYSGYVDDIRYYNRILSPNEIQNIASSQEFYPDTDGLMSWNSLEDGIPGTVANSTASDWSGNGLTLNCNNASPNPSWIGGPLQYP